MKPIFIDFLHRALPWWLFIICAVFVTDAWFGVGFLWAATFAIPLGLDLTRGSFRVEAALPVTRRSLALFCWLAAVGFPVVITTSIAATVGIFHPPGDFLNHLVLTAAGSLGIAGALFLCLTCGAGAEHAAFVPAAALWPIILSETVSLNHLHLPPLGQRIVIFPFLLLALLGFIRAEKLLLPRSSRLAPRSFPPFAWRRRSFSHPGAASLRGVFFRLLAQSLYTATTLAVISKIFGRSDMDFMFLGFMSIVPIQQLLPLRHMRLLPFSTRHLALLYIAAPFLGVFASGFFVSLSPGLGLGRLLPAHPFGPLLCLAGADVCAVGLELRLGLSGQILGMFLLVAVAALVGNGVSFAVSLPCFSVALLAAYMANTSTLGCSATYRVNRTLVA